MKLKKFVTTLMIAVLFLTQFSWINLGNLFTTYAVTSSARAGSPTTVATKYFYNQLTPDAKVFYEAMEELLIKEDFNAFVEEADFGKKSIEITAEKLADLETKLNEYVSGKQDLLNAVGAARDAFMSDYAEVFYIDWDYFSMRVLQKDGQKHLYIGTGRSDNYVNKDFIKEDGSIDKDKIKTGYTTIQNKINEIVEKANAIQIKAGQNKREQQIKLVHEEVIKLAKYTLDYKAEKAPWSVRTVYGVFASNEAACAGYARALKVILDRLQIPCVLVTGIYKATESQNEEHMWTYVQLDDGKWYAVDPTFDNTDEMEDGSEKVSMKYFLVGFDKMAKHIPTGIVSESNFEFSYPPLEAVSDKYETVYEEGDIKVELDDESWDEHDQLAAPMYKISYKGMGYTEAAKKGYYILVNQGQEYEDGTALTSGYYYARPDIVTSFKDSAEAICMPMAHISYFQVAVTDIAPAPKADASSKEELAKQTTYFGTETSIIEQTDIICNPLGTYKAPPYVKKATPSIGSSQMIGTTYHVSIEYDDFLIPDEDETTQIGVEVHIFDRVTGRYDTVDSGNFKVENFEFDEQSTVSFDFTPSEMFADDSVFYEIQPTGLMGVKSHKRPMGTSYLLTHGCALYAYKAQGFDLNLYGKPVLMDDVDVTQMNIEGMSAEEKEKMADLLKHRLTLVTQKTTDAENKEMLNEMNDFINKEDAGREVLETETYNISLTLCKMQSQQLLSGNWNGNTMRVMLGFPAGYGPEDEGVTFKVYHYGKDENGNTVVDEVPCTVTKLGLVLEVKSFSPFTIAAVKEKETEKQNTDKTIVLNTTEGGKITMGSNDTVAKTITKLGSGQSETVKIKADEGYEIDEIIVGETIIDLKNPSNEANKTFVKQGANNTSTEFTLDLKHDDVNLEEGTTMIKASFVKKEVHEAEGEAEVIAQPVVAQPSFTMTSKVYKQVTTGVEETSIRTQAETLKPNDEFEVTFSVDNFLNIGEGINTIAGTVQYDKSKLQYIDTTAVIKSASDLKWGVTFNEEEGKFVATLTNDSQEKPLTKDTGEIFTMKFKVKTEDATTDSIVVTNLSAGTGRTGEKAIATANSISAVITITPEISDVLTVQAAKAENEAKNYRIDDTYISLPVGTTVQQFEDNTDTSKTAKYLENIEATVDDRNMLTPAKTMEIEDTTRQIHTGDQVTVGNKTWTFVVRGDIDGDGKVGVNDLAKAKLHFIRKELVYGAFLAATETDDTQNFTVNDISRIKLYIIQKITDLFADLV